MHVKFVSMITQCVSLLSAFLVCQVTLYADAETPAKPVIPKSPISLFNGQNLEGLYTYLEDTNYRDDRAVFSVNSGVLVISGDGYGGITTRDSFKDYRLVCEFSLGYQDVEQSQRTCT